jgi:hypothetical protein
VLLRINCRHALHLQRYYDVIYGLPFFTEPLYKASARVQGLSALAAPAKGSGASDGGPEISREVVVRGEAREPTIRSDSAVLHRMQSYRPVTAGGWPVPSAVSTIADTRMA